MKNTSKSLNIPLGLKCITPILLSPKVTSIWGRLLYPELKKKTTRHFNIIHKRPKNVLVIRLDDIGDLILSTPFIRELRQNLPDAWITLIVNKKYINLIELCPYVNETLAFEAKTIYSYKKKRNLLVNLYWNSFSFAKQNLWSRKYDVAILPRWETDLYFSSFLGFFSRAQHRVSYSEDVTISKKIVNHNFNTLFTTVISDSSIKHEVNYGLDLLTFLKGKIKNRNLELWLDPADEKFAENFLSNRNVPQESLIITFGLGAGNAKRKWPTDRYIELGRWINQSFQAIILLVGGMNEAAIGKEIQENLGNYIVNAVNKTSLRQTAALLKKSSIYIGNDSGAMHMMSAAGGSIIEISCHPKKGEPGHFNSPIRFGPWEVPHVILQPKSAKNPCQDSCLADEPHCILDITVEQTKNAIKKLMT